MLTNIVFSHEETKYEKVLVSNGDTLWSIASSLEGNINRNIYEIKKVNNLEKSNLYVGQELLIPMN
ncbi:MAG: LysM peptidoglycan-binding domain-containing protein [Clostridia bacterium]|nr:LysM peptidoglycan-binding domain-containing protein [Clostridia bacterium]